MGRELLSDGCTGGTRPREERGRLVIVRSCLWEEGAEDEDMLSGGMSRIG
jgi:hypothetical protein